VLSKSIGSVLLILGTCIGGGMLALPVVTASQNFSVTAAWVVAAWAVMTLGAFALLKANLSMPDGTNLISMARKTVGPYGAAFTWFAYLFLLYSLLCAYLAATSDVLHGLMAHLHLPVNRMLSTVLVTLLLGSLVYRGLYSVDRINRVLMFLKMALCFLLMLSIAPYTHMDALKTGAYHLHGGAAMVVICSFGFAIILPSLRTYLESDSRRLHRVLFIGSLLPMLLYLVWIALIQSALQRTGAAGLEAMNHAANTNTLLMHQISMVTHNPWAHSISVAFISICAFTAFLGVSVCMMDFLADGLRREKKGKSGLLLACLTYGPPMLLVLFAPWVFTEALAYAGVACLYVLILLPFLMYFITRSASRAVLHDR
jgi:tyrosine-specific transport protein